MIWGLLMVHLFVIHDNVLTGSVSVIKQNVKAACMLVPHTYGTGKFKTLPLQQFHPILTKLHADTVYHGTI